jgi:hypothetical protein
MVTIDAASHGNRYNGTMATHPKFSSTSRIRQNLSTLLPIASILLCIAACLPIILVSDFSKDDVYNQFRMMKRGIIHIMQLIPQPTSRINYPGPIPSYSLANVMQTVPHFHDAFGVLVYDPESDKFIAHYSTNIRWTPGCHKLVMAFKNTANMLRTHFPDRFNPNLNRNAELVLAIGSGDYPKVNWNNCLLEQRDDCFPTANNDGENSDGNIVMSPILQFSSVFRRPLFSTMIAMPLPQINHLGCFQNWSLHHRVCDYFLPRTPKNPRGLIFGETIQMRYHDLIPQIVWRGTDFTYLQKMFPSLRRPNFETDVVLKTQSSSRWVDKKIAATGAMREIYASLVPRWKGVVWTAEAERDAERANKALTRKSWLRKSDVYEQQVLPWCNIKFASAMNMGTNTRSSELDYYKQFEEYGIPAAGEHMTLEELGQYKYHIDLGGGGGTTWSGTLEKLALPGVLFHHITPTKDYLHDLLEAWVHYIPIKADLSDLREKYEWAEAHPHKAKTISDNATKLMKTLGTERGFEDMFRRFYEWPMRQVLEAYQPVTKGESGSSTWREAILQMGGEHLRPIMQCDGHYTHGCEYLVDDIDFKAEHHNQEEAQAPALEEPINV